MGEDLLRLLSSRKNQEILALLAVEPSYPRRIAAALGAAEPEVARRLRRLKEAGLLGSERANLGHHVMMYRLAVDRLTVKIGADGLEFRLAGKAPRKRRAAEAALVSEGPAPTGLFVGRQRELEVLRGPDPVVVVLGLPGIGKTSLLAHHAGRASEDTRVFWCSCRGVESFTWMAHRLGRYFAQRGDDRLLRAVEADAETAERWALALEAMDAPGQVFLFDDVHRLQDESLRAFIEEAATRVTRAKIVLAGREPNAVRPQAEHVRMLQLEGLPDEDVVGFLQAKGIRVTDDVLARLRAEIGGHPLALTLLVASAEARDEPVEALLDRLPKEDLDDYLLREVDGVLAEDERRVMTLASLFRTRFTLEDLQALTERPVAGALLRLRRRLLIEPTEGGYLMHETLRNFFRAHLGDRARLHLRLAERYLAQDTEEGRLEAMHHLLAAGRRDRVLEMLETNLDLRAFEQMDGEYHDLYFSVLATFPREQVADDRRWALMEDERGDILYHRGELKDALACYDEALRLFRARSDAARVADVSWKRALALVRLGRHDEAEKAREEGLLVAPAEGLARRRLERLAAPAEPTRKSTARRKGAA